VLCTNNPLKICAPDGCISQLIGTLHPDTGRCPCPGSAQQGIRHLQARNPAPVAEILGKEKGAAATDRSFGDQGIEDQIGVGAQHLKAGQGLQQSGDLLITQRGCSLRLATERNAINTWVLTTTSWSAITSASHLCTRSDFHRFAPIEAIGPEIGVNEHPHQARSCSDSLPQDSGLALSLPAATASNCSRANSRRLRAATKLSRKSLTKAFTVVCCRSAYSRARCSKASSMASVRFAMDSC
jgi:hypothetical protein